MQLADKGRIRITLVAYSDWKVTHSSRDRGTHEKKLNLNDQKLIPFWLTALQNKLQL